VDEGPWSVEQVVRLRRENLRSEVTRVKKKADRVGHTIDVVGNVVGTCSITVGVLIGAALGAPSGAACGGVLLGSVLPICLYAGWAIRLGDDGGGDDGGGPIRCCPMRGARAEVLHLGAQALGIAQPMSSIGALIGLELVAALRGHDYEDATRTAARTMEVVVRAGRAEIQAIIWAQEHERHEHERMNPRPDWGREEMMIP
jgi:hypothetical protein